MSDAFTFNPRGLNGVDAPLRAGLRRFLASREREINSVARQSVRCTNGPFAGQTIELEAGQSSSVTFTVGKWSGRYVANGPWAEWRSS